MGKRARLTAVVATFAAAALMGSATAAGQGTTGATLEATIAVDAKPERIVTGFGDTWTLNVTNGSVTRIDGTGETRTVRVGPNVRDIAAAYNRIWVLRSTKTTATVVRLVPGSMNKGGPNITIPLGSSTTSPFGENGANTLGIAAGKVWVAGVGTWKKLAYINPSNSKVTVKTFPIIGAFAANNTVSNSGVTTPASLWVVPTNGATLQQRDPDTLKIEKTLHMLPFTAGNGPPQFLSFGVGALWMSQFVPNDDGAVAKVDPKKGVTAINGTFNLEVMRAVAAGNGVWWRRTSTT